MESQHNVKRIYVFENIAHYLTAAIILLKGFDKIGTPGKTGIAILFITIGFLIALGTLFHHKAQSWLKHLKAYVLMAEAIVVSLIGYLYVKDGKQYIQYACFTAAIIFIVAFVIYVRKEKSSRQTTSH